MDYYEWYSAFSVASAIESASLRGTKSSNAEVPTKICNANHIRRAVSHYSLELYISWCGPNCKGIQWTLTKFRRKHTNKVLKQKAAEWTACIGKTVQMEALPARPSTYTHEHEVLSKFLLLDPE